MRPLLFCLLACFLTCLLACLLACVLQEPQEGNALQGGYLLEPWVRPTDSNGHLSFWSPNLVRKPSAPSATWTTFRDAALGLAGFCPRAFPLRDRASAEGSRSPSAVTPRKLHIIETVQRPTLCLCSLPHHIVSQNMSSPV